MSGATRSGATKVVDEAANPLDTRFAGGAPIDGTSDSYAALAATAAAVVAAGPRGRMFLPPYTFHTTQGLVVNADNFVIEGAGSRKSRIELAGAVAEDVLTIKTINASGYSGTGRVVGIAFCTSAGAARTDSKAGLVIDGLHHMHVQDCYAFNNDIAFDLRNNCYGTRFIGCSSDMALNRVGLMLRGDSPLTPGVTAGSGSDITMLDNWFGGSLASIWMEPNAGGYHVYGGQLAGGSGAGSAQDTNGSVLMGRGWDVLTTTTVDAAIGATSISVADSSSTALFTAASLVIGANQRIAYTGKTGGGGGGTITGVTGVTTLIPAGTPLYLRGRVAQVELHGVSFEGTDKRHAVRAYGILDGVSLNECSVNSNGANRIINVVKGTDCVNSVLMLRRLAVRGFFSGTQPLDLQNFSGSWDVMEESPNVVDSATFNSVAMNLQTQPMVERSGVDTRARAFFGDKIRFGGRSLRWNSGVLEAHTDSSAAAGWTALGSGGVSNSAPLNTVRPSISGTTTTGSTLSGAVGTWSGTPTVTFTYRWLRNGVAIGSATANSYQLISADEGQNIVFEVTGSNGVGNPIVATSLAVVPTASGAAWVAPVGPSTPESKLIVGPSATYIGGSIDTGIAATRNIDVQSTSDVSGTLSLETSTDQVTWTIAGAAVATSTVSGKQVAGLRRTITTRYYRVKYVNGATGQLEFSIVRWVS